MENDRKYKLYFHINNSTGEVFYVGIGIKKRPYDINKRNKWWNQGPSKKRGIKLSQEVIDKMSKSKKGKPWTQARIDAQKNRNSI